MGREGPEQRQAGREGVVQLQLQLQLLQSERTHDPGLEKATGQSLLAAPLCYPLATAGVHDLSTWELEILAMVVLAAGRRRDTSHALFSKIPARHTVLPAGPQTPTWLGYASP